MTININAAPAPTPLFVLKNNLPSDCNTSIGRIPKGGSLNASFLPPDIMASIAKGGIICTPTVTPLLTTAPLSSSISAYASAYTTTPISYVTTFAQAQVNDANLAKQLAQAQTDLMALRALVYAALPLVVNV